MFDVLKRINELREERGWSVYKLAKLTNIPQSTIATWYQKNLYPPVDKLEILCEVFGISLSEFFYTGSNYPLSAEQLAILQKWALLSDKEKNAVIHVIDTFLE